MIKSYLKARLEHPNHLNTLKTKQKSKILASAFSLAPAQVTHKAFSNATFVLSECFSLPHIPAPHPYHSESLLHLAARRHFYPSLHPVRHTALPKEPKSLHHFCSSTSSLEEGQTKGVFFSPPLNITKAV